MQPAPVLPSTRGLDISSEPRVLVVYLRPIGRFDRLDAAVSMLAMRHVREGRVEIVLDRKVSDKRIFPSLDVGKSGTRKEELLVEKDKLSKMWVLRRILMQMGTVDAMEFLLDKMKDSKSNEDFFATMNQ